MSAALTSTSQYIQQMQQRTTDGLRELHEGVTSAVYCDFPDHNNVGDAAIVAGQREFWAEEGIDIPSTFTIPLDEPADRRGSEPVLLQGGGSFGGTYPVTSHYRNTLAATSDPGRLLIQLPQSVEFTSDDEVTEFRASFANRANTRIAVRDEHSRQVLADLGVEALLVPDAVHVLGRLDAPAPTQRTLVLARRDEESASGGPAAGFVDWAPDPLTWRMRRWATWRSRAVPPLNRVLHRSTERWIQDAHARLARGTALLARAEVIVTDRLHAMLLGLQLGRQVVAVDNVNHKLTRYVSTWPAFADAPMRFAPTLGVAIEMADDLA